jgi:glycosidase
VFNHVGRDFWAFRDVLEKGPSSPYCRWFKNLRFGHSNGYGNPFSYEGWNGCMNLVKLDLANPEVRDHLFEAVRFWMSEFAIDGLRLDAADCLDFAFIAELSRFCKSLKPDFWLMGEVIHGDYTRWAGAGRLDSVTNYEAHKGLWSCLNDANYFEIAYALKRQSGEQGAYRQLGLYNFADNHDVNRVASTLNKPAHLFPLHILLYTMPGVPSLYYGSEFGVPGIKNGGDDSPLRPELDLTSLAANPPAPGLCECLKRLSEIRKDCPALRAGGYRELAVSHRQFAFERSHEAQSVIVALNAEDGDSEIRVPATGNWRDLLNPEARFSAANGSLKLPLNANWGRILIAERS